MASKKPVAPVKPAPKAPVVAPGPKAPVVAPPPKTKLGPNDIEVKTWDVAEKQYRTRLFALLVNSLRLNPALIKQGPDPNNNTPLNAIMAQVPVHLLEHSKTGVCEINITVKVMRRAGKLATDPWKEATDISKTLTPKVQVNLDGWNVTKDRPQPPHIGFNVQEGNEWHVFVTDPMPKGVTVRGELGSAFEPFETATLESPKGTAGNEKWNVKAEIRRRPPPNLSKSTGLILP